MDEDALNMAIRRFLKQVGVTGQREIEKAVRGANVGPGSTITLSATITAAELGLSHEVTAKVTLA